MGKNVSKEDIHSQYDIKESLGKGNFATVKRCRRKKDGAEFAVKIIKKSKLEENELKIIHQEVEIMHKINHQNVVRMYEIFENDKKLYIVLELLTGGELFDRVVAKGNFSEREAADVVRSTAEALKYLHDIGVVHRDLKPENLLYETPESDSSIKITDFGLAKFLKTPDGEMKTQCGTPGYVAPEVLFGRLYNSQVDMWSLGVILYILLCGFPPFYAENGNTRELYRQIKRGEYSFPDKYWKDISPQAKDLVRRCLTVDPDKRITAAEALEHEWLRRGTQSTRSLGEEFNERLKLLRARAKLQQCVKIVLALVRFRAAFKPIGSNNGARVVVSSE